MRLLDAICNRPWLTTPESLRTIVEVVSGERRDEDLAAALRAERENRPAALALRGGTRLEAAPRVTVRDGVAHIGIIGPIVRRADLFTRVSGLASLDGLAADLDAALSDPGVRAILLELDTPGGEVTGIAAFAQAVREASQAKPVHAYVDGMAASAGYWIASAATTITIDPAGLVGSIGAVLAVRDPATQPARAIEFVSSQSPYKRANPTTDDGRAQYQRIVDQTAEAFIEAVATYRGATIEAVLSDYGQGGLLVGRHALAAHMVDGVGTFEQALASLATTTRSKSMDWTNLWRGFFTAAKEAEPVEPDANPNDGLVAALTEPPAADPDAAERIAKAEAEKELLATRLAEAETRAARVACEAFVAQALSDGRIVPAEASALTALYAEAQHHGFAHHVEALIAARPAHLLTTEHVAGTSPAALSLARASEPDQTDIDGLLALTPEGRAALAARAARR